MVKNRQNEEKYGGNLNSVSTIALLLLLAVAGVGLTTLVAGVGLTTLFARIVDGFSPLFNNGSDTIVAGIGKLFSFTRGRFCAIYCATCKKTVD